MPWEVTGGQKRPKETIKAKRDNKGKRGKKGQKKPKEV